MVAVPVDGMKRMTVAREHCEDRGAASDNLGAAGVSGGLEVLVERREGCVYGVQSEGEQGVAGVSSCCTAQVCLGPEAGLGLFIGDAERVRKTSDSAVSRCPLLDHLRALLFLFWRAGGRLVVAVRALGQCPHLSWLSG